MKLLKPEPGDPQVAARIRAGAAAYLRPADAGDVEGRRRVAEYRRLLAGPQQGTDPNAPEQSGATPPGPGDATADGESEEVIEYRRLLAALNGEDGEDEE